MALTLGDLRELVNLWVLCVLRVTGRHDRVSTSGWVSGSASTDLDWYRFVRELAATPVLVDRLLAVHTPDAAWLCAACTTPGRGTSRLEWPCALRQLAEAAKAHRAQQRVRDLE